MRAILCNEYGSFDTLVLEEVPEPDVRPGTILVEVSAAGVNYVDTLVVQGKYQIKTSPPFIPGSECVGRVIDVADDVARDAPELSPGSRVLVAAGSGTYAERVVAPAHSVTLLPSGLSDGVAATFTQSYMTGMFALRNRAAVEPGDSMLVIGAGGGVGLAAVDIGSMLGLRVFAAASSEQKRQLALERGAEVVFDIANDDIKSEVRSLVAAGGKGGVDLVYDPVGGDQAETWLRSLGNFGKYLVVGFVGGIPSPPLNLVLLRNRSMIGIEWGAWASQNRAANAKLLAEVMQLVAHGRLHPVEPTEYPLEQTVEALRDLAERRVAGKLVVVP